MVVFKPPGALVLEGNLSENWRRWVQCFDLYLTALGKIEQDEKGQCAILLHKFSEEVLQICNTFRFATGEDPNRIADLKKKFEDYYNPRKNTVFERYKFWECKQQEGESIDQFNPKLKTCAKSCQFGAKQHSLIVAEASANQLKEVQTSEKVPVHAVKPRNKPTKPAPATSKTSRQLQQCNCKNCGAKQ